MSSTKYVIVIPDGATDEPFSELDGMTPLEAARIPEMDRVAREGIIGRSRNVPDRFLPASDVATLSLLGYDPVRYYTGRAPLEAAAMGIALGPDDWAVRCNLMTINEGRLTDFTAGHITSAEGRSLMEAIQAELGRPPIEFHPGVSYRNLMVYRGQPGESSVQRRDGDRPASRSPRSARRRPSAPRTGRRAAQGTDEPGEPGSRRPPRQPGPRRGRQAAGQRDLALGTGEGAPRAEVLRASSPRGGHHLGGRPGARRGRAGRLDADRRPRGDRLPRHRLRGQGRCSPSRRSKSTTSSAFMSRPPTRPATRGGTTPRSRPSSGSIATSSARSRKLSASYDQWRILITPDHSTLLRTRAHDRAPVAWAMAGTGLPASRRIYDELAAKDARGPYFDEGYRLMDRFLDLSWDGRG